MSEQASIIVPDWHAVMSRPKAEHLAAAHLGKLPGVEAYCPRIRFEKATRRGRVWFVEALFPGYLFARFNPQASLRAVQASPQVAGVVRFGAELPALPAVAIADLMAEFSAAEPRVVTNTSEPREGDTVEIIVPGGLLGLVGGALAAVGAAEPLHLFDRSGVCGGVECRWRRRAVLVGGTQGKRLHGSPLRIVGDVEHRAGRPPGADCRAAVVGNEVF